MKCAKCGETYGTNDDCGACRMMRDGFDAGLEMVGLDAMLPHLSPAAMLGEALRLMREAQRLVSAANVHVRGVSDATWGDFAGRIAEAKREAEARGGYVYMFYCHHHPTGSEAGCAACTPSCWQCEMPRGFGPERCLTCAAKRAEDMAGVTP